MVVYWLILFWPLLLQGSVITLGDASAYRPFPDYSRERWQTQRVRTYWNPYTYLGMESVASLSDARPQYLPDLLLDATERLSEPARAPQFWLLLMHLLGAGALMLIARLEWHVRWSAALCSGLVWLSAVPLLLPFAYGHDAQLVSDATLPLLGLGVVMIVGSQTSARRSIGICVTAASLAIALLHGHPQITVYAATFAAALAVCLLLTTRRWAKAAPLSIGAVLGLCMGAALWIPVLVFGKQSFRGGGGTPGLSLAEVEKFSLGWRDVLSFVWPQAVGYGGSTYWGDMRATDYSPYLGIVGVFLACAGAFSGERKSVLARFLFWAAIFACVFSLGTTLGPLFGIVRNTMPLWSRFRVPFYLLVIAVASIGLLAARGAGALNQERSALNGWRIRLLGGLVLLGGVAALGLTLGPLQGIYSALAQSFRPTMSEATARSLATTAGWDLLFRVALLVACVLVALRWPRLRSWAAVGTLSVLLCVDSGSIVLPQIRKASGPRSAVDAPPPTPLAQIVRTDRHSRGYVGVPALRQEGYYEAYTNHWVAWRAACVTGLAAFPLDSWRMVMKYNLLSQEAALRAFGVGYIDLPARDAASSVVLQPLLTRDSVTVYRLRRGLGRAFTVPYVLGVEDDDAAARAMSIPGFDPGNAVVVSGAQGVTEYRGSRASRVTWAKDGPDSLVLVVDAPDSTFLVVADSYFPGWKATIDDRPVPIRKVNLLVRGVEVPAGRHEVTMTYETVGSKLGVALTRLGLALWAGLALWTVFVAIRRRSPATPAAPG